MEDVKEKPKLPTGMGQIGKKGFSLDISKAINIQQ
jgi:hypothetical protein